MKEIETIQIEKRMSGSTSANMRLRKTGYLPASIYGKGIETISVSVKSDELRRVLSTLGRNAVFNLKMPSETPVTVMIKEIQYAPSNRAYSHVDFHKVSLSEEIHTDVEIKIIGVEVLDSKKLILMRQTHVITVKGFPQDIPDNIEIDVSNLKLGESLHVSDIKLPQGLVIENDLELVIASVTEPRAQETEVESDDSNEEWFKLKS